MLKTHAVGIDLGTTYSCIAYLNEHGEPVTLPNQEGELSTPSVVLFDGDETVVGTAALQNAIMAPERVVQNSKRFMGDPNKRWVIDGKPYTPIDIAAFILKKLLSAAQEQIGPIEQAVITVPAQFSDAQRHATVQAGHRAGLQQVDIINEPVAAALCYVLGTEGLWFTELAEEQKIMVYDLGGGTFDLSLVRYQKDEVSVIASTGDLNLGGIDWNQKLLEAIARQFAKEFRTDPRDDAVSLQSLALEVERTKRSLSVRPRSALMCHHDGHRKTYQVELAQFEKLTKPLVDHTSGITKQMLKDHKMGWAHVDVVLTTGGASRMPMIRTKLKNLSGTTLNTSLSPDLSIAHGATYYAGMLLTNQKFARSILNEKATERLARFKQRSVNARGLGILVRDPKTDQRVPHYLIRANTTLPASVTQEFGTVIPNQRRVHLQIVESGISRDKPPAVLGECVIDDLPPDLPEGSQIGVTISYDSEARVHVSAKDLASGKQAATEIIRQENLVEQLKCGPDESRSAPDFEMVTAESNTSKVTTPPEVVKPKVVPPPQKVIGGLSAQELADAGGLDIADQPVPLCNKCGEPLNVRGQCPACHQTADAKPSGARKPPPQKTKPVARPPARQPVAAPPKRNRPPVRQDVVPTPQDEEIIELDAQSVAELPPGQNKPRRGNTRPVSKPKSPVPQSDRGDQGEEEFWQLVD